MNSLKLTTLNSEVKGVVSKARGMPSCCPLFCPSLSSPSGPSPAAAAAFGKPLSILSAMSASSLRRSDLTSPWERSPSSVYSSVFLWDEALPEDGAVSDLIHLWGESEMLPGPLRAGSGWLWKETAPRAPTSAHVHPRRLPDKGLSCLLLVEDPLRMPLPDTPPHSHACWGAGEAWSVPLSTIRAAYPQSHPVPSRTFVPRGGCLAALGDPTPPFQHGQGSGYR